MESKHAEDARTINYWEAKGGEPNRTGELYQYGRRFDGEGTYTIYHVFSGEPATIGAWRMNGISPKNAARALHILNSPRGGRGKP
jgi:hypothetical protein